MKRLFFVLFVATSLAFAVGCGGSSGSGSSSGDDTGDATTDDTTDTGDDTGADTTDTGADTTDTGADTTDTGGGDDGNNSFEEAVELTFGEAVEETLNPTADTDYFSFAGTKGQVVGLEIFAQDIPFEAIAIDTVMTLYDEGKNQIALNDDPFPRSTNDSRIYTILPADGTYYVEVEECTTWLKKTGFPGACADPIDKKKTGYQVGVFELTGEEDNNVVDAETGNTADDANAVTYGKNTDGNYLLTIGWGTFADETDVDVYAFNIPEDVPVNSGRSTGNFEWYPGGVDGNGSSSSIGATWIASAEAPDVMIAWTDGDSGESLQPPLDFGADYLLFISHPGGAAGANDFYFFNHSFGGSNPLELDDEGNNALETAEALVDSPDDAGHHFFIEGDITEAGVDVDHFTFELSELLGEGTTINVACGAQRSGSGLRQFQFTLLDAEGNGLPGGKQIESAKEDASILDMKLPAGATSLLLKVEAGSQAEGVTSTFYRCGVHVLLPQ